jgi:transposase-like protein
LCLAEKETGMPRPDFPRTFEGFRKRFAGEEDCWRYLVESRWPQGFRCPDCGHGEAWTLPKRALLECRSCGRQRSVTAGTILHRTRLPLSLWFAAAYLVTTHTPGFSALQWQRQLGLTRYETAFVLLHKLRRAMRRPERDRIAGTVEVDEAYVGGVDSRQRGGRQRDSNKSIVVGAVEVKGQRSGRPRLAVVPDLSADSPNPVRAPASCKRQSNPAASSSPTPGRATHRCARPTTIVR